MKHRNKKNGFTLIEALLVLSIFTVLSLTALLHFQPVQEELLAEHFFEQFQKDILFAQQHAVMTRIPCTLIFNQDETGYRIRHGRAAETKDLLSRKLPEGMKIVMESLGLKVTFLTNGNISDSGTVGIMYRKQAYRVTFYLGKGRFVVKKV
ncbi:competence type IV pilus minor pilin ComGD [Bacillus sp. FJAT-42376]|uniref:competence type IV pilus minor pilin ComGD n=1 Tax=Bacillus sp. FJAT-42376 TaxID=2014076 RepID=UPI0013DE1BC9|nr:competence type IV pilus minor pilin ComGD [Bacillus sp. FJAT-42376]